MLTKEEVEHIARLARIGVTEEEVKSYQKDLSDILDYFKRLDEVDTQNIEPIGHITGMENIYRDDVSNDFGDVSREKILENVPDSQNGQIKVKSVF